MVISATGGVWTGGSGSFMPNDTCLYAEYFFTQQEIDTGFVVLILTTTGNNGCPAKIDTMLVTILESPIANAGNDTSICHGDTITLSATSGVSYIWNNTSITQATYTEILRVFTIKGGPPC